VAGTEAVGRAHRLRRMTGRDTGEEHRTATPLELLYDLTFVVAFGQAADQFAHLLAEGHVRSGLIAFGFGTFAICWAWINFSWFASAYDTDDWVFRLATMVQMVGVIIVALGLPQMFRAVDEGHSVGNSVAVAGPATRTPPRSGSRRSGGCCCCSPTCPCRCSSCWPSSRS
jgi:Bacterial low temperature requirement A protein (LtrA)